MAQETNILFQVTTRSTQAPSFDGNDRNYYHGYFENEYGEKLVFTFNFTDQQGVLWHSDNDWEAVPVTADDPPGLILGVDELLWLKSCWMVVTTRLKLKGQSD